MKMTDDIKSCAEGNITTDTTSSAYLCPIDGASCEVVSLFQRDLVSLLKAGKPEDGDIGPDLERTCRNIAGYLPCEHCRVADKSTEDLPRLRLGGRERAVLLAAPKPEGSIYSDHPFEVLPYEKPGRSASETQRRAIRKLARAGLIWASSIKVEIEREVRRWDSTDGFYYKSKQRAGRYKRSVCLTPTGAALVERLGGLLREGKPIRWVHHHEAVLAAVRRTPEELIRSLKEELSRHYKSQMELAKTCAVLGSSSEARYWQQKAIDTEMALRAVQQADQIG
jgi:hypothetical protein